MEREREEMGRERKKKNIKNLFVFFLLENYPCSLYKIET